MSINGVHSPSFKAYVPVVYYAKNPANGKFSRVSKSENIKKCNRFVISNLNGTAKKTKDDMFVSTYKNFDKDYFKNPVAKSFYDDACVYLFTGNDADSIGEFAKPIGRAKGEAMDKLGHAHSWEAVEASRTYVNQVKAYIRNTARQLRAQDGTKLEMQVFFDPTYNKKGKHTGFTFLGFELHKDRNSN